MYGYISSKLIAVDKLEWTRHVRPGIKKRWQGHPIVVAFLFAHPGSDAMQMVDARGNYFDTRTGDTWDLYFPGYHRSSRGHQPELADLRPVGDAYASEWYFSPASFNKIRSEIERSSARRWEYSGGTDLVLTNGWVLPGGDLTVDWASTISGQVSDRQAGINTLTLANVIERITRDLEYAIEDSSYGVSEVTGGPPSTGGHITRDFMVNALAGIAAALAAHTLGY